MASIRVPELYIPGNYLCLNKKTNRLEGHFAGRFYHYQNYFQSPAFNFSFVKTKGSPTGYNLNNLDKSSETWLVNSIEQDEIDINPFYNAAIDTGIRRIPKNVTLGPQKDHIECKLATFPNINSFVVRPKISDSLNFLETSSVVALLIITIGLITLAAYFANKTTIKKYIKFCWITFTDVLQQQISSNFNTKTRIIIFTVALAWFIFQLLLTSFITIEMARENKFRRIDTLKDVKRHQLQYVTSVFSHYCNYLINFQHDDYKNRIMYQIKDLEGKTLLLPTLIKKHSHSDINKIACLMRPRVLRQEKTYICNYYPKDFVKYPIYESRKVIFSMYQSSTINKKLDLKSIRLVKKILAAKLEMGLNKNTPSFRLNFYPKGTVFPVNCYSEGENMVKKWTESLDLHFYYPLMICFLFSSLLGLTALLIELTFS